VPRKNSVTLNLRIDPELKKAAEKAAMADRRSLTTLIEKLLSEYLVKHGFLAKDARK
jgi:predicted HicB family RNase H-like nuclease